MKGFSLGVRFDRLRHGDVLVQHVYPELVTMKRETPGQLDQAGDRKPSRQSL